MSSRRSVVLAFAVGLSVLWVAPSGAGVGPGSYTIETVDSGGSVGTHSSLVLDTDGHPVIAYRDGTNMSLKVAHCNDPKCAGADSIETVDSPGVGDYTSVALDANGHPVVSYYDFANMDLKVAHCTDPNCAGAASVETVDSVGNVGLYTSLELDANGHPVVSYRDSANGLKLAHCNDPNCAGADSIEIVDSDGGTYNSLALDAAGNPVISYRSGMSSDLKVAHCNDPNCAGGNESIHTVDSVGVVGRYTSLALDASGDPVVSYRDGTNGNLKLAHCNDPNCAGGDESLQVVDSTDDVGAYTSLALDQSGDPVISYEDVTNKALKVAHCNDPNCAGGNEVIDTVDVTGAFDLYTSLALAAGHYPVVSYSDGSVGDLLLATENPPPPHYVMVGSTGTVYAFPQSQHVGNANIATLYGAVARDIVINHEGTGYYVLDSFGIVHPIGPDTASQGNLDLGILKPGETPVAMALTATGNGYWIFTNLGRAAPLGDASDIGDVSDLALQGAIVDAAPYPPGFYMGAADGGVFTPPEFIGSQDVPFYGSMGGMPLNEPIVTIYIDATDHDGYSLAAADGGMFNFKSEFCGSIPGILAPGASLNQPIVNAVPYGDCYIFFAADGGAFVFGNKPFLGSLGDNPPANPIVSGDAYAT